MRSENDGNVVARPRGNAAVSAYSTVTEAEVTSHLAELESMLWQALGRIGSLEKENVAIRASMERETAALRARRQREGDGGAASSNAPCSASPTDLESLPRHHALGRIDSLEKKNAVMERETKALRDDVKSLKEENRALKWSLNQLASRVRENWEYPCNHCIQPDEYWLNRGIDYDYIDNLNEYCIGSIRSAVSDLAHGVCENIYIGDNEESLMIMSHGALMPHWHALSESFRVINPYGVGMKISFENMLWNEEVMGMICNNLFGRNIREVAFSRIQFANTRDAILALRNMLIYSPQVKSLVWSEIPIDSDDMALFTQMLSDRPVEELRFVWNGSRNARALLAGVDLSKYKRLDFDGNSLRTNGRADIQNLIASNSPLESLNLDSNRLNDDDAVLIAKSLGRNTRLKQLYLENNNIQERGKNALLRAVRDTSSMNALSDSNHSCCISGGTVDSINAHGQFNRIFKIHTLMVERHRSGEGNVPCIKREMNDECSVLLAPFILESIHRRHMIVGKYRYYVRGVSVLGLLHELVKDWTMPELFNNTDENHESSFYQFIRDQH